MLKFISHAAKLAEQIAPVAGFVFSISGGSCIASKAIGQTPTDRPSAGDLGVASSSAPRSTVLPCGGRAIALHGRGEQIGLRLGEIYSELGDAQPRNLLPASPLPSACAAYDRTG